MKMLRILMILMLLCATIATRTNHPHHQHHHRRHTMQNNKNISTTESDTTIDGAAERHSEPIHMNVNSNLRTSQKLVAIGKPNSRHYYGRSYGQPELIDSKQPNGEVLPNHRSTTSLHSVENFGEDTWRRNIPESTTPPSIEVRTRRGRNYHKNQDGRHVCSQHKLIQEPIKTTEIYTKQTWRHVSEPCFSNQICTRLKMFQEPAQRDVIRNHTKKHIIYFCCPGWEQGSKATQGCPKPICKTKCKNGGTCNKPDTCSCPKGFTGKFCERDINECKENKPCDQLCYNTQGSYYCKCREGFILQSDQQSCKKIGKDDGNAFEARDLENEIDTGDLTTRLHKLEKVIATDRISTNQLQKTLQSTSLLVDSLKTRVNTLEHKNKEITDLQNKLRSYGTQTKKLEQLVNRLISCRTNPLLCP